MVYILNKNLETVCVVDSYASLIWANRYDLNGDCELYLPANDVLFSALKIGNFIIRSGDEMVCQIRYFELDTNAENGDYIIVKGVSVTAWLDQRVVWETMTANGNAEAFVLRMVDSSLGNAAVADRMITNLRGERIFFVGSAHGFTEASTEQVSYKNVGEKVREYCRTFGWGYRVKLRDKRFVFEIYKGEDKRREVIFSDEFENLITTTYTEDASEVLNVALVAGEGQGSARSRDVFGAGKSDERVEVYVDAKDISKTITWGELEAMYPMRPEGHGYIHTEDDKTYYMMDVIDIQIVDASQLARLKREYPAGEERIIDGNLYYRVPNVAIADMPSPYVEDDDDVELRDIVYSVYLLSRAKDAIAGHGIVTSFNGEIEPRMTFQYRRDYNLGDIVTIQNRYGVSVSARIVEVIEVFDANGYSVQPKYEYIQEDE